ncbi:MAG: YkgJ family cysteine cluster protein [Nitrospira sp.]|nr:YkgJ family cysteine cluster protein [Nitrospira sp.]
MTERFEVTLNTPAGRLTTALDVPTEFIPITAVVPIARRLGEEAGHLEEHHARERGRTISCRMGCAACCRMLVPVSPPEAFALRHYVEQLPAARQTLVAKRIAESQATLQTHELWERLWAVAEADSAVPDEELDPLNRAYYALRHACPFLENEMCSIYEARPAACRELQVTSPAEYCADLVNNPVVALPVSMRIGTVLGLLWGSLTRTPPRLIPLPIALGWAAKHEEAAGRTWPGSQLIDELLDKIWRFLSQEFEARKSKS